MGRVGSGEVRAQVGDTVVVFPDGVAPSGTEAVVRPAAPGATAMAKADAMSGAVEITLSGGLQPQAPLTVTLPVRREGVDAARIAEGYLLFVSARHADGTESFETGVFDPDAGTFTFETGHLSDFRVMGIDIAAVFEEAKAALLQTMGLVFPAPDCVGEPAVVGGLTYEVASPPGGHLCVGEVSGNVVITAHPAVAMPFAITTNPRSSASTLPSGVKVGTMLIVALADNLEFIGPDKGALIPGVTSTLAFSGSPRAISLQLEQYPVLMLMTILAATLDVFDVKVLEALGDLGCLTEIASESGVIEEGFSGESVGTFGTLFFGCLATFAQLSIVERFVVSLFTTAPALLYTSVAGLVNELSGQAVQRVDVRVTPMPLPTDDQVRGVTLPPNTCGTGTDGWSHDQPIRLKGGVGEALTPRGEFAGASVLETRVVGRADLNGDGIKELVLELRCTGSRIADCCAGRTSQLPTVAVFHGGPGTTLTRAAPSLMGGSSAPGDSSGPAARKIGVVTLKGTTVVTTESIVYPEQYTAAQVGGDPYAAVTVEYRLGRAGWAAQRV